MSDSYFDWLRQETATRVWINNPTAAEVEWALANGAVACTSNPAFGGNLLGRAPAEIIPDIKAVAAGGARGDRAVAQVQERLVARILPSFIEQHERSGGREGWVSLQGAPALDTEVTPIVEAARAARALAPNCIPKIPATMPGLEAMERLVRDGEPVLMTEVFSLAQVIETCERYGRATEASGHRPVFIMAPITGIFGDHLGKLALRDSVEVGADVLAQAGVIWAREAKRLVDARDYPVQLLYGGARSTADLTGLVGGPHAATINWSTYDEVLAADPPRVETVEVPAPAGVRKLLTTTFKDFERALDPDGLALREFESFGPVQHFRDAFIAGWEAVREALESPEAHDTQTAATNAN
jgi:transaldolase